MILFYHLPASQSSEVGMMIMIIKLSFSVNFMITIFLYRYGLKKFTTRAFFDVLSVNDGLEVGSSDFGGFSDKICKSSRMWWKKSGIKGG